MANGGYEIPNEMRDLAEKSVDQAKKAFDGFLGAASKAVDAVDQSASSVQANVADMARKAFGFAGDNVAAAFDLAQKMVRAKDVQEVMHLQAEFLQGQMQALQTQMREIGAEVQKAAQDMTKPKG